MHARLPRLTIVYCTGCRWMLRAAWLAQEALTTFEGALGEVALVPNSEGGVFEIHLDGERLWSHHEQGGFPEAKELKRMIRDRLQPERGLGHVDEHSKPPA